MRILKEIADLHPAGKKFKHKVPELKVALGITDTHGERATYDAVYKACSAADLELPRERISALVTALLAC